MQIRYRLNNSEWKMIESSDLDSLLKKMSKTDRVEIALKCDHNETWTGDGVEVCKFCQEYLKVTKPFRS